MSSETHVLYNDTCPVCRFEIDAYRKLSSAHALPVRFDTLDLAEAWGLTPDQAARQLHVRQGDRVIAGLDAFRALWSVMPGWGWLARLTGVPVIRPLSDMVYARIAAPLLYRAHLRRQKRYPTSTTTQATPAASAVSATQADPQSLAFLARGSLPGER
jgi:predicted DCC family thiol-disulfide oxidoreductase YuxK